MSTRALISIKLDENSFVGVYCHHDGYPSYLGNLLLNNYTNELKIWQLLAVGDMSAARKNVEQCDGYYDPEHESRIDYSPRFHHNLEEIYDYQSDLEYVYIWDKNEQGWYYNKNCNGREIVKLTQEICNND